MGLLVWLPLIDGFKNKGLHRAATITNTNTTFGAGGVLGNCCTHTTGQNFTITNIPFSSLTSCTVSFWAYHNAAQKYVSLSSDGSKHLVSDKNESGTGLYNGGVGNNCKIYVDGVESTARTTTAAWHLYTVVNADLSSWTQIRYNNYNEYTGWRFAGKVFDLRIYDNVLTDEDVKRLYQNNVYHFSPYWKHNENVEFGDAIHIGRSINQTAHNLTQSGSSWYFNGSSSYVEFNGLNMSGGSVSAWVNIAAKPTAQRFIYYDPVSKMVIGFLSNGNFLTAANGTSKATYQSTGMTWGQWNHIVATWDAARQPTGIWVNGVAPATASTNNWTTGGTIATIGRRIGAGNPDYLQGYVNSVRVYSKQLTQAEAKQLYNKGIEEEDESIFRYMKYSGCTWLKVLHHNSPATNLFTSANGKRNDDSNLYSRLGLFDNNTNFRMPNNKYEFLVREKLESTHTESAATWVQTSSPTASTVAGYQLISSTPGAPSKLNGLTHQDSRAVFDDAGSSTWWCSCGCNTAYQGGIPGFFGLVKSGYIDLYIRVDDTKYLGIADVPSDYTMLSYIEATGTQWINTDLDGFDATDWEIFCEWKLNAAPTANYGYVFGIYEAEANNAYRVITNQKSTTNYLVNPCSKAGGGSVSVNSLSTASTHTALVRGNGTFMVDGSSYSSGTFGTALPSGNKMGLFKSPTGSSYFKGRIYAFWAKKGGSYKANMVPAKRNSDNIVGMYDTVRKAFFTNSGTGSFTAGSIVTI